MQQDAIRVIGEDEWGRAFDIQADAFSEDPILGHWLVGGRDQEERARRFAMEKQHPTESAHWYLLALGTRRDRQGQGIGGRLLSFGLARVDAERMPAYLESSNPRNISLYERHGFHITRALDLPKGAPTATAMWRDVAV